MCVQINPVTLPAGIAPVCCRIATGAKVCNNNITKVALSGLHHNNVYMLTATASNIVENTYH